MKLIVGLGNPGLKHEKTRHNLGFMALDSLFKNYSPSGKEFNEEKKFQSLVSEILWQPKKGKAEKVILLKPQTFMNLSGVAVSKISSFYKIKAEDIWVVHDEVDLPLGALKIRLGGSSAGHKGVESILEALKTDKFWRFRMGMGPQKQKTASKRLKKIDGFVLGEFSESEKGKVRETVKKAVKALEYALENSLTRAMNRFNTK